MLFLLQLHSLVRESCIHFTIASFTSLLLHSWTLAILVYLLWNWQSHISLLCRSDGVRPSLDIAFQIGIAYADFLTRLLLTGPTGTFPSLLRDFGATT